MEISREAILDKTHYGLKIYAYVLRQYYPNQTVLSVKGRDCGITRNPFNGGKETLRIHIDGIIATHRDTELEAFKGDVFDFAQYHFRITDEEDLYQKINQELHLNLEVKEKNELEWLNEQTILGMLTVAFSKHLFAMCFLRKPYDCIKYLL